MYIQRADHKSKIEMIFKEITMNLYTQKNTLLIEVNQICNLQCTYCFYNDHGRIKEYLNVKMLSHLLSPTIKKVFLTGGEPFLNPDIIEIIHYIKSQGIECTVFCNGIALSRFKEKEILEIIQSLDRLIISFDSFREDYIFRSISPVPILQIIEKILILDSRVLEIKVGLNNYNIDEFESIIKNLISLGVQNLSINLIHNIENSDKDFEIKDKNKIIKIYDIVDNYIEYFDEQYVAFHRQYIHGQIDQLVSTCAAGKSFFFVNTKGHTFGCPAHLEQVPLDKKECICKECINLWEMY